VDVVIGPIADEHRTPRITNLDRREGVDEHRRVGAST
jgi:hypothetical protein